MTRRPVLFEMEASDPDDFMTLLWLADHPGLELRAAQRLARRVVGGAWNRDAASGRL
jgi:hypothetical protein